MRLKKGKRKARKPMHEKIGSVTVMKDLFGAALCYSIEKEVDMAEIVWYTLTPKPLSLGHTNGSIHITQNKINYFLD